MIWAVPTEAGGRAKTNHNCCVHESVLLDTIYDTLAMLDDEDTKCGLSCQEAREYLRAEYEGIHSPVKKN